MTQSKFCLKVLYNENQIDQSTSIIISKNIRYILYIKMHIKWISYRSKKKNDVKKNLKFLTCDI